MPDPVKDFPKEYPRNSRFRHLKYHITRMADLDQSIYLAGPSIAQDSWIELVSAVKIEPQSVLACFTHWVLPYQMVETGLNGLHKLHAIIALFICHGLLGKSGFRGALSRYCEIGPD